MIQPVTQGTSQIKTLAKWHINSMTCSLRHPTTVFMKIITSALIAPICIAATLSSLSNAAVVTVLDNFTTNQSVQVNGAGANTQTIASAGSIGGYRTMTLTSSGNSEDPTTLSVSNTTNRLALSTPVDATANFTVSWAGATGTGFGATDLTPYEELSLHKLKFALRSADFSSSFTWTFEDISGNSASYTGNFPAESSSLPNLQYEINFADFANSGSPVDWNAINKISLSGGGTPELDVSLIGGVTAVPEPTTALLSALGVLCLLRRKR